MFNTNSNTADCYEQYGKLKSKFAQKIGRIRDEFCKDEDVLEAYSYRHDNSLPPVNISESESFFTLQLFAAGLKKDRFKIEVKGKMLVIRYLFVESEHDPEILHIYREFVPKAFQRSFQLDEQVSTINVAASYEEGVLTVILPKDPLINVAAQEVQVG
ncbi:Hsp20/alpha crystallin family protein [Sphingobacterium sp. SYP-B4668]|uniref:Hsp20/alpha crystallin family protein n=1 Tax=Sphingobacterium sp. SYP-B4668 TaxID=2996035 RepID=UPI0022DE4A5E|nr:Hsp20/alpha crystallin family protein [Sphingobacterium sp. SYP-B4668]